MSLICPQCQTDVATRDGVHYGVHYPALLEITPCKLSCKPIVTERPTKEIPMLAREELTSILDENTEECHLFSAGATQDGKVTIWAKGGKIGGEYQCVIHQSSAQRFAELVMSAVAAAKKITDENA